MSARDDLKVLGRVVLLAAGSALVAITAPDIEDPPAWLDYLAGACLAAFVTTGGAR